MQFQTTIPIAQQSPKIDYSSKLLLLGSCFAKNISTKLEYYKFKHTLNPFGIIFHPLVLERLIQKSLQDKMYSEVDTFKHNEQWHCFDAHSILSNSSKEQLINALNTVSTSLNTALKNSTHIVITLGTAWGYAAIDSNHIVSNCHKLPQNHFKKRLASVEEVTESLRSISQLIQHTNATAKVIFTVSPIRHIKDGFVENMQSKSHVISAVHKTISETNNTVYFPSYELMMDELRDYRFYAEDMLHPNQTAINYIWQRFTNTWLSPSAIQTSLQVGEIQKSLTHKPFNPSSKAHQTFLKNLQEKIETLQKKVPQVKF